MQKLLSIKGAVVTLGALVLSLVAIACGGNGASNNDQGMAVTFLGLFNSTTLAQPNQGGGAGGGLTAGQGGCGQLPSVFVGGAIRLGEAQPEPAVTLTDKNSSGTDESGAFVSVVGIQNNLYGQLFRADRVLIDYYVPGARAQPPSTNAPDSSVPLELVSVKVTEGSGCASPRRIAPPTKTDGSCPHPP